MTHKLVFIWVTGVLVDSYSSNGNSLKFRKGASRFLRKLSYYIKHNRPENAIVLVTAKPRKKIEPVIKVLIKRTGIHMATDIKILSREDVVFADKNNSQQHNIRTPDAWRILINHRYNTNYRSKDMIIVDCNTFSSRGELLGFGRNIAAGYIDRTILLKPESYWHRSTDYHARDLEELEHIIIQCLDSSITDIRHMASSDWNLPTSVFTSVSQVFNDQPKTIIIPAPILECTKKLTLFFELCTLTGTAIRLIRTAVLRNFPFSCNSGNM